MKKHLLNSIAFIMLLCSCAKDKEVNPSAKEMVQGKWETVELLWQFYDDANKLVYEEPYKVMKGNKFEFGKDSLWITAPDFVSW